MGKVRFRGYYHTKLTCHSSSQTWNYTLSHTSCNYNPLTPLYTFGHPPTSPPFSSSTPISPDKLSTLQVTVGNSSPARLPSPVADTASAPLQPPSRILSPEIQVPQPDLRLTEPKANSPANKDYDGEPESLRLRFPWAPRGLPGSAEQGLRIGWKTVDPGPASTFLTVDYISQKAQRPETRNNAVLTAPLGEAVVCPVSAALRF